MIQTLKTLSLTAALSFLSLPTLAMDFPHLTTSGYGEVVATPDMAEFSVTVVASTKTAEQAKQKVDEAVARFISTLTSDGVKKQQITSSNLHLSPQYHYPNNKKRELTGYHASRRISVTVLDLEKLNPYLDLALSSGINQVDNIQLKVKDTAKYQQQARDLAIQDAQQKAHALAKGFGSEIQSVWRISYNTRQHAPVYPMGVMMEAKVSSDSGYQDATLTISDSVDVLYRLQVESN